MSVPATALFSPSLACVVCATLNASVFEKDGVEVVVDSTSLDLIRGATVDYSEDMMRAAFQIVNNPNAEGGCGCGVSFRPKEVQ